MRLHLNITLQRSIVFSWFLTWALITGMPVIHANSSSLSSQSNHCPVASMQLFDDTAMGHTSSEAEHSQFYHCPLCHCAYILFDRGINILLSQNVVSLTHQHLFDSFHYLSISFKPARSPPTAFLT